MMYLTDGTQIYPNADSVQYIEEFHAILLNQLCCHCVLSHEARYGAFYCSGLGAFDIEESTLGMLCVWSFAELPGEHRHSCRPGTAGAEDDFPAAEGREETLGKGESLTIHTVLGV